MDGPDCYICAKHRSADAAQGGVVFADDLVYVGHIHAIDETTAYRGYLMIEPRRHVPMLGDLSDEEAGRLGQVVNRAAAALRSIEDVEHVYSFVFGDTIPHLHIHLAPRYPGTPPEYWGARLREWPDAPKVDEAGMRELVANLQRQLAPGSSSV